MNPLFCQGSEYPGTLPILVEIDFKHIYLIRTLSDFPCMTSELTRLVTILKYLKEKQNKMLLFL